MADSTRHSALKQLFVLSIITLSWTLALLSHSPHSPRAIKQKETKRFRKKSYILIFCLHIINDWFLTVVRSSVKRIEYFRNSHFLQSPCEVVQIVLDSGTAMGSPVWCGWWSLRLTTRLLTLLSCTRSGDWVLLQADLYLSPLVHSKSDNQQFPAMWDAVRIKNSEWYLKAYYLDWKLVFKTSASKSLLILLLHQIRINPLFLLWKIRHSWKHEERFILWRIRCDSYFFVFLFTDKSLNSLSFFISSMILRPYDYVMMQLLAQ